jgi:sulfur carrier protein ThiS
MAVNKKYKNSIFVSLFDDKHKLISLYNALTGSNYPPDTEVEVNTLQDILFKDRYNDLSFTIAEKIVVLIEHQSTLSDNYCLRLLIYAARVYEKIFSSSSMYRRSRIPIPKPEFIVLYNGIDDYPKEKIIRLSDSFMDFTDGEAPNLELIAKVININYDISKDLVSKDANLEGYSYFVYLVGDGIKRGLSLDYSIREAIKACIAQNKLREYLEENGSEVINLMMGEWNMDEALRIREEEGREEGRVEEKQSVARYLATVDFPLEKIAEAVKVNVSVIKQWLDGSNMNLAK